MVDDDPPEARFLALVFFDKQGDAVDSRLASEFAPA
jgi:hypothetical protein